MNAQLPLALRWPAHQRFASFMRGSNGAALDQLAFAARALDGPSLYVAGAPGSGRTHALIATCAATNEAGRTAQYLSLAAPHGTRTQAINGIGGSDLLAIDDVDAIAGDRDAELALFDLYNRTRADRGALLFAATAPPAQIGLGLPDLVSRLSACTQISLKVLGEEDRRALLRERALARGIELDDGVLDWLFARGRRDLASLLETLDRIDRASLAAQRRVTVPFLRTLLEASGAS